ncbi:unnamed protein product [Spirodela intermedia]|uniref:Uncharacterized protein n=3 Tax=Spirodela intermedia TaxID=51605 RepID=A0A7I8KZT1_SPIIN|nr:unnamed protein product [Spirodela intermedia]CAA6666533.1 unnamed protein product [Spirodela intermedia]CAA7403323.1 unnamed protein product [Spirodela intermedia]
MEMESTAISAFWRPPVRTTRTMRYQISRQSMTAEARESLTKAQRFLKAAEDKPVHASLHQPTT